MPKGSSRCRSVSGALEQARARSNPAATAAPLNPAYTADEFAFFEAHDVPQGDRIVAQHLERLEVLARSSEDSDLPTVQRVEVGAAARDAAHQLEDLAAARGEAGPEVVAEVLAPGPAPTIEIAPTPEPPPGLAAAQAPAGLAQPPEGFGQ